MAEGTFEDLQATMKDQRFWSLDPKTQGEFVASELGSLYGEAFGSKSVEERQKIVSYFINESRPRGLVEKAVEMLPVVGPLAQQYAYGREVEPSWLVKKLFGESTRSAGALWQATEDVALFTIAGMGASFLGAAMGSTLLAEGGTRLASGAILHTIPAIAAREAVVGTIYEAGKLLTEPLGSFREGATRVAEGATMFAVGGAAFGKIGELLGERFNRGRLIRELGSQQAYDDLFGRLGQGVEAISYDDIEAMLRATGNSSSRAAVEMREEATKLFEHKQLVERQFAEQQRVATERQALYDQPRPPAATTEELAQERERLRTSVSEAEGRIDDPRVAQQRLDDQQRLREITTQEQETRAQRDELYELARRRQEQSRVAQEAARAEGEARSRSASEAREAEAQREQRARAAQAEGQQEERIAESAVAQFLRLDAEEKARQRAVNSEIEALERGRRESGNKPYTQSEKMLVEMLQEEVAALPESVVRNPAGKLKPVYHGTRAEFESHQTPLQYFTESQEVARSYAENTQLNPNKPGEAPQVREAYLDIKKPLDLDAPIDNQLRNSIAEKIGEALTRRALGREDFAESAIDNRALLGWANRSERNFAVFREALEALGYDGMTEFDRVDPNAPQGHRVWITFKNEQIVDKLSAEFSKGFVGQKPVSLPVGMILEEARSEPRPVIVERFTDGQAILRGGEGIVRRTLLRLPSEATEQALLDRVLQREGVFGIPSRDEALAILRQRVQADQKIRLADAHLLREDFFENPGAQVQEFGLRREALEHLLRASGVEQRNEVWQAISQLKPLAGDRLIASIENLKPREAMEVQKALLGVGYENVRPAFSPDGMVDLSFTRGVDAEENRLANLYNYYVSRHTTFDATSRTYSGLTPVEHEELGKGFGLSEQEVKRYGEFLKQTLDDLSSRAIRVPVDADVLGIPPIEEQVLTKAKQALPIRPEAIVDASRIERLERGDTIRIPLKDNASMLAQISAETRSNNGERVLHLQSVEPGASFGAQLAPMSEDELREMGAHRDIASKLGPEPQNPLPLESPARSLEALVNPQARVQAFQPVAAEVAPLQRAARGLDLRFNRRASGDISLTHGGVRLDFKGPRALEDATNFVNGMKRLAEERAREIEARGGTECL